jgi:hypothetical protein
LGLIFLAFQICRLQIDRTKAFFEPQRTKGSTNLGILDLEFGAWVLFSWPFKSVDFKSSERKPFSKLKEQSVALTLGFGIWDFEF